MQEKLARLELGFYWWDRREKWFEGLGGKRAAKMVGHISLPLCVMMEKNTGKSFSPVDDFAGQIVPTMKIERMNLSMGAADLPDWKFRTTSISSAELDTDENNLMLMSREHQQQLGIRLDVVQNVCHMWNSIIQ